MTEHGNATTYVYGCRCAPCTEANRVRTRTNRLLRNGWTDQEYEDALQDQDGRCAICRQVETRPNVRGGGLAPLSADHDHGTGVRRGLLCGRCNLMIGNANEDVVLLGQMIAYLARYAALPQTVSRGEPLYDMAWKRRVGVGHPHAGEPLLCYEDHAPTDDIADWDWVDGEEITCCDLACYEDPGCACESCEALKLVIPEVLPVQCDHGTLLSSFCWSCYYAAGKP